MRASVYNMPIKPAQKVALADVHYARIKRIDFDCNRTLSGREGFYIGVGQLPTEYHDDLQAATGHNDFYVIRSYDTPIAWFANGEWWVPNVKYSATTTRHLNSLGLSTDWRNTPKDAKYVTLKGL